MNWLKKGPELKIPKLRKPKLGKPKLGGGGGRDIGIKSPAFLGDLYSDLRDRRLLLPLALVLVAIAAVPFLLGDSEPVEPPAVAVGGGGGATQDASASFAVVEAKPGLRDYRKRLDSRTATNPFKQRYTSIPDDAQVESTSVTSSAGGSAEDSLEADKISGETGASPGGSNGSGDGASSQPLELVIDAQVRRTEAKPDGSEERGELEVRKNAPVLAKLPGEKTPVVTLMGANLRTERLVFLVSHEVAAINGEFSCVTRADVCELLEVGVGTLLDYTYEPSGAHYEVKVTDVNVIPAHKRRSAQSSRVGFAQASGRLTPAG